MNAQWRRTVRTFGNNTRAHLTKRRDHSVHWAFGQARVRHQPALKLLSGQKTREKPHGRARIAAIDFLVWRGEDPFLSMND
jgi:hypothetical protein